MNILIIDDQEDFRSILSEVLLDKGHTVMTAANGKKGIDLLALYTFDCIVTDIIMPEIEGIEFILRLRQSNIPIISISGLSKEEFIIQLLSSLGMVGFLQKPFTNEKLLTLIEKVQQNHPRPVHENEM